MLLNENFDLISDNLRIQRLMGINRKDGKATMETIPSVPNRSQFSCERYQFFLDAPFEIGNNCCRVMKKNPMKDYQKKTGRVPITAQMASESRLRTQVWLRQGCNAFDAKKPMSNPMSFWTEQDVLAYVRLNNIKLCSVYGDVVTDDEESGQMNIADFLLDNTELFDFDRPTLHTTGCKRTGCVFCLYSYHHEKQESSRINDIINLSNPKLADYMLRGGRFDERGLWIPYHGLGMWFPMLWSNAWGNMNYWFPNMDYYRKTYGNEETERYLQ